ncbi:MAG TPA: amidohydrolase [Chthoniobacterales bacterium]|nr:amidohydrolase [Chthoniobacterales bacterium]
MKLLLLIALSFASAAVAVAQQTPQHLADAELPSLVAIYKQLHAAPELSGQEEKTAAFIAKELRATGCEVTEKIGKYEKPIHRPFGVVGVMKNGAGPTVWVRADMDALPVKEETGVPYASKAKGKTPDGTEVDVMHACGHDIHMSALIGAARALSKLKDQWKGTLVFVGQPAEEIGSGARAMMADGLYTRWPKPDFVVALHDSANGETGKILVSEGYALANVDSVNLTIRGVGGHGAYPHTTKDPVVIAAETIMALQTIDSREANPLDPVVVTVGSIHGGTKHNIISDEVKMQLTVRTYKPEVREQVLAAIERIAKGIAASAGVPPERAPIFEVENDQFTPSTYNDPELTKRLVGVWKKTLGDANVEIVEPVMGGEDFSIFNQDRSIPTCIFWVGAVDPAKVAESKKPGGPSLPSLHSSKFAPVPEPTIRTGVVGLTSAVLDLMKK